MQEPLTAGQRRVGRLFALAIAAAFVATLVIITH
jgi:hypothetical protein